MDNSSNRDIKYTTRDKDNISIDMMDTFCLRRIIQHLSPNLEGSNYLVVEPYETNDKNSITK